MSLGQTIILGDLNTQHPDWGRYNANQLGKNLKDSLLNNNDLIILNDKRPNRISINRCCPDLAFCSSNIFDKVRFDVGLDGLGSDHLPLLIYMNAFDNFLIRISFLLLE